MRISDRGFRQRSELCAIMTWHEAAGAETHCMTLVLQCLDHAGRKGLYAGMHTVAVSASKEFGVRGQPPLPCSVGRAPTDRLRRGGPQCS